MEVVEEAAVEEAAVEEALRMDVCSLVVFAFVFVVSVDVDMSPIPTNEEYPPSRWVRVRGQRSKTTNQMTKPMHVAMIYVSEVACVATIEGTWCTLGDAVDGSESSVDADVTELTC
jgi:hypothetical protein